MNPAQTRHRLIEKMKEHPDFSKPEVMIPLLEYLDECTDKNILPDESMIASTVFKLGDDFDSSSDTRIRVYMSKLRKKLSVYFQKDGSSEKFRLEIPKGHYRLELISNKNSEDDDTPREVGKWKNIALGVLVVTTGFFAMKSIANRDLVAQRAEVAEFENDSFIWSNFLQSELPSIISIGQILMFSEFDEGLGYKRMVRDPLVFSEDGLSQYAVDKKLSDDEIEVTDYENIPESALRNFARIQPLYQFSKNPLEIEISSNLSWEQLKANNMIYLGHFHNLGIGKAFFPKSHFYSPSVETDYERLKKNVDADGVFQSGKGHVVQVTGDSVEETYVFDGNGSYVSDYVVVSKVPGPNGNTLLYLVSFHQIGRMEVVKALTNPETLREIKDEVLQEFEEFPPYFEMLLEVKGFEDTAMKTTLKHFFPLPSKVAFDPLEGE